MSDFDELIEMAKTRSRQVIESGEEHRMIMIALHPKGATIGAIIMPDERAKAVFKTAITTILQQMEAYTYVIIHEAWMTKIDPDSPLAKELQSGEKLISDLPPDDKAEVVIINAAERNKSFRQFSAEIKYTPDDKRYISDWKESAGTPTGRMIVKEW